MRDIAVRILPPMAAGAQYPIGTYPPPAAQSDRRRGFAQVATVGVLVGIVLVLTGAAVAVTLPPPPDALDRLYPLEPGATWVYDVTVNDQPSGRRVTRVLNAAQVLEVEGAGDARAIQDRYDEDPVTGTPTEQVIYLADRANRLLLLGERDAYGYLQNFPPQVAYQAPIEVGTTWTWANEFDPAATVETTLVDLVDVDVAGTRFAGCQHLRRTTATGFGDPEVTEEWVCPGVGPVRRTNETLGVEEVLVAHRSDATSIGDAAAFGPPNPAGAVAVAGTDPARSNAVSGQLDATQPLWTTVHKEVVHFPPLLRDGVLAVADESGAVSATDATTGEVLWRHRVPDPVVAPPVLAGDVLLVADAEGALRGLDLGTGATRWWRTLPGLVTALSAHGDTVIVAARDRTVRGLSLSDGAVRWTQELSGVVAYPPAVAEGVAVVADETGGVTALVVADGSVAWGRTMDAPLVAGPAIAAGTVVVADEEATLSALSMPDGVLQWSEYVDTGVVFPAAVTDDVVVVAGETLRGYGAQDGELRWESEVAQSFGIAPVIVGDEVVVVTENAELLRYGVGDGRQGATTSITPPSTESGILAQRPVAVGDDALIVMFEAVPPLAFSFVTAYPLAASDRAGVQFTAELRPGSSQPVAPVAPTDGGDLVVATELGSVEVLPAAGPPVTLLPEGGVAAYAVPAGDRVVVHKDGDLLAVPVGGGEPLWRVPVGEPQLGSTAVVSGDLVVAPADDGATLLGVDLASGEQRWAFRADAPGIGRPLLLPDGDVAYGVGGLVRLDPTTGIPRWRVDGVEALAPIGLASDSLVVAGTVDGEDTLLAVAAQSGERRWEYGFTASQFAGPASAGDLVVVAEADGFIAAADAVTGDVVWTGQLDTPPSGTPAVLGDVVIFGEQGRTEDFNATTDRYLALDVESGTYLGAYQPFATNITTLYPAFSRLDEERVALWHLPEIMILRVQR